MSKATIKRESMKVLSSFFDVSPIDDPRPVVIDSCDVEILSDALAQTLDRIIKLKIKINEEQDDLYCNDCKKLINIGEKYVIVQEECLGEIIEKPYCWECAPEEPEDDLYISDS